MISYYSITTITKILFTTTSVMFRSFVLCLIELGGQEPEEPGSEKSDNEKGTRQ